MTDTESHIRSQAAIARSKGESPGRCELCGHIILYSEKYGECPDTDALTCETCATEGTKEWDA